MQPITVLYLFPVYATREDYEKATGQPCPPWNPTRRPKGWCDPNAKKALVVNGVPFASYQNVYVGFDQVLNVPLWDMLGLPVEEAKTVNIAPDGPNVAGGDQPAVPCPCRPLADNEVIRLGFGATPQLWTADEVVQPIPGDFTLDEKTLLLNAARKVLGG